MQEDFLHYIWKYGLYPGGQLLTGERQPVSVISPGQINRDAGPDFSMARIKIGEALWCGDVEIHVRSSDWYRHRHEQDPAYVTVVLHLVYEDDMTVSDIRGRMVPTAKLPVNDRYLQNYHRMLSTLDLIPCSASISRIHEIERVRHFERMGVERMEQKSQQVRARLLTNRGGWEETLFQLVIRYFAGQVNQEAFDQLGRSLPQKALRSLAKNQFALEALLFGMTGLLTDLKLKDAYVRALQSEFFFQTRKFNLTPPSSIGLKRLRMRPSGFPEVRLAQLAAFLHRHPDLPDRVIRNKGIMAMPDMEVRVSGYWERHLGFGRPLDKPVGKIGEETRHRLLVNVFLPYAFVYLSEQGDVTAHESWLNHLSKLPPEQNRIVRLWSAAGVTMDNALWSQAGLYLYTAYCRERRCLACGIGQRLISSG